MIKKNLARYKWADRITERKIGNSLLLVPFEKTAGSGVKGIVLKNDSAQFIWKLCEKNTHFEDIVKAVIADFSVDKEKAIWEIRELLEKLLRLELVICSCGANEGRGKDEKGKIRRKKKMGKA